MNELFEQIFSRLDTALTIPVFDDVPQDFNSFPYIKIDPMNDVDNDTDAENGFQSSFRVHVYSAYRGSKECVGIQSQVYDLLQRWVMSNTSSYGVCGGMEQTIRTVITEPDGITRHGVQQFNFYYEQLPS